MSKVIDRLGEKHPHRQVFVIYRHPLCANVIDRAPFLQLFERRPTPRRTARVVLEAPRLAAWVGVGRPASMTLRSVRAGRLPARDTTAPCPLHAGVSCSVVRLAAPHDQLPPRVNYIRDMERGWPGVGAAIMTLYTSVTFWTRAVAEGGSNRASSVHYGQASPKHAAKSRKANYGSASSLRRRPC
jgi:hypothetical protein